MLLKKKEVF